MEESQLRDRITRWIEESNTLLALLPGLVTMEQTLTARVDHAENETVRLRKETFDLQREVEGLRQENAQLRAEKEEAGQALAKVLETVQATNHIAQKLGVVTKSPFARRNDAPAPTAATPTPNE